MKADFITPSCCSNQSIAVMDYRWPEFSEQQEIKVNRVCLSCCTHWAGVVSDVKQYTRKEWDAYVNDVFFGANQSGNDTA